MKKIFNYFKIRKILLDIYKNENLINRFSLLYRTPFKVDYAGRLYAVVNPLIQDMTVESNTQIFEFTSEGVSNRSFVENWMFNRLYAIDVMLKSSELMELLTLEIKDLGNDNYLIIFKPAYFDETKKIISKTLKLLSYLIILTISITAVIILI